MPKEGRDRRRHRSADPDPAPKPLLARILDTPNLARAVPQLQPELLHRLIDQCGLEDCAELVALATPAQLSAVFDLDLWSSRQPGEEERFDADRFGVWLEVLLESGAPFAAGKLAAIDPGLVVTALAEHIRVFDAAAITPMFEDGQEIPVSAIQRDEDSREVGGYVLVPKIAGAWDAIIDVLTALDEEHPGCFHRLMSGCRALSNSKPEADGFYDLMSDDEQARFDLALGRERRREQQGFVTPAQARAFLEAARELRADAPQAPPVSPVAAAYFRDIEGGAEADEPRESVPILEPIDPASDSDSASQAQTAEAVAAVVGVLLDAGVLPERTRGLLPPAAEEASRLGHVQRLMQFVREHDDAACSRRDQELAFLANILVAGCAVQARAFTPREASDAVAAVCNLGLENWPAHWRDQPSLPDDLLVDQSLATVFQVGWAVLHRDVCLFVAEDLVATLAEFRTSDRDLQAGLDELCMTMTRCRQAGQPWRARGALEALAMLDLATWAALVALTDECPVMLANVGGAGGARPRAISTSAFEFISENRHVQSVRAFMRRLPEMLFPSRTPLE